MSAGRIAVIGDVGGHADALVWELRRLGADPVTGTIPDDLTIVQVGDLIHRGPDSDQVIWVVDRFLTRSPGQWVQLIGNHEAQYVHKPAFQWHQELATDSVLTLKRWWATGLMQAAVTFTALEQNRTRDYVVTHAGLTAGFWRKVLKARPNATAVSTALNARSKRSSFYRPGQMLTHGPANRSAGPLWAASGAELIPSWLDHPQTPFSQVHGHSTLVDWRTGEWRCEQPIRDLTTVNEVTKHATTRLRDQVIIGLDPGHEISFNDEWCSWEVQLALPLPDVTRARK